MINKEMKYGLNDLVIVPAEKSTISSRSECNPFEDGNMLPIITSPMYSVVDNLNIEIFIRNGIHGIFPRGCEKKALGFDGIHTDNPYSSFGLDEFESIYLGKSVIDLKAQNHILIDIANGHMKKLEEVVSKAKGRYGKDLYLMVGNVANPKTFQILSDAGADAVRIGIGGGSACLSSANAAVHYPMASLIDECYGIKQTLDNDTEIVADGGFRNFDDIIKALALGADKVMLGSILNRCLESAAKTKIDHSGMEVDQYSPETLKNFKAGLKFTKEYYGMSTKRAQSEMGNKTLKTSEGIQFTNPVEYTVAGWLDNFKHYLKTAMSYTGKKTLNDFKGEVTLQLISQQAQLAYRK